MQNSEPSNLHTGGGLLPETAVELPPFLKPLKALEGLLHWLERALLVLLLGTLVGLSFLQIVFRNLSNFGWEWAARMSTSLIWSEPFLRHVVLLIAFFGASIATREGRHLHIDVVSRLLPPRPRVFLKALTDLFSAVICLFLAHATLGVIQNDPESVAFRIGSFKIQTWLFCTAILGGFVLLALRFLIRCVQDLWRAKTGHIEIEVPPL